MFKMSKEAINMMGLSIELIGLLLGAWIIGGEIDKHYELGGMGLVATILVALFSWFVHVVRAMKRLEAEDENENKEQ